LHSRSVALATLRRNRTRNKSTRLSSKNNRIRADKIKVSSASKTSRPSREGNNLNMTRTVGNSLSVTSKTKAGSNRFSAIGKSKTGSNSLNVTSRNKTGSNGLSTIGKTRTGSRFSVIGQTSTDNNSLTSGSEGNRCSARSNSSVNSRCSSSRHGSSTVQTIGIATTVTGSSAAATTDTEFLTMIFAPAMAEGTTSAYIAFPSCLRAAIHASSMADIGSR